jgi:hypothetical protein
MRRSTRRTARLARLLLPALLGAAALAACSDQQPVGVREVVKLPPAARTLQAFTCTGSQAGTLSCAPASGGGGDGAAAVIIPGSPAVQLASSNVTYNSSTGLFQFDVTVKNLLNEAIGTPDGSVADPDGIQLFFHAGPTATGGSGTITVLNADGTGTFTAANQPYFAYSQILAKNAVSSARTWQLNVPSTVTTFSFTIYVETDVQYLLVINEVLVNPGGTIFDANGEWLELYNAGTLDVDLQNLVIADSAASGRRPYHLITSSVVVPSGGYATLGNTQNTTSNGGATIDYAYGAAMAFANSLDALKISRVVGTDTVTIDRVSYLSAAISAQNGISRELLNPALDNADMDGANWADASTGAVFGTAGRGTPKAQNSTFVP